MAPRAVTFDRRQTRPADDPATEAQRQVRRLTALTRCPARPGWPVEISAPQTADACRRPICAERRRRDRTAEQDIFFRRSLAPARVEQLTPTHRAVPADADT